MIGKPPSNAAFKLIISIALAVTFLETAAQEPSTKQDLLNKMRVSGALFRGRVSTVIAHPVKTDTRIARIKVTQFLKGCGDSIVNLYVTGDAQDMSVYTQKILVNGYKDKPELLIFACARDENGIGWDLSPGLGGASVIKWNFRRHFTFQKEVEEELGCLGCCKSQGKCGNSQGEAEKRTRESRARRQLDEKSGDKRAIGELLGEFALGKNRKGAGVFFGGR